MHPVKREAIALCGDGALTPAGTQHLTRAPYLQSTTTRTTTVAWGAREATGEVVLRKPGESEIVARAPAKKANLEQPRNDIQVVKAELSGLEPTYLYCYQVVANGVALTAPAPLSTAAAPARKDPIRFIALGDSGTGGKAQRALMKRISEVPFDFMLLMGDIAYESGTATQLEKRFFAVYRDYLRYVPAYPAIGNHERRTQQGRPYFDAFVLPGNERYYSFDWGDVHIVAIDTTQREADQLRWLDADLARNKLPWVIVFGHHPPYTSSFRGPQKAVRRAFAKILTQHEVDLVVSGHEHHYERFRIAGVNYIISGGGGARLNAFWGNTGALKQAAKHHFLAFEATATSLKMRVVGIDGEEIETLALEKGEAPKVDDKPEHEQTPLPAEKKIESDPTIHDGPDDDVHKPTLPEQTGTQPITQN